MPGLEEEGRRATALNLPSAGIDATTPGTVTPKAQADRVIAFLDTLSEPVVLVGHSTGGPVISMVAEARPQKVEKLASLTAVLLPDGVSQISVAARDGQTLITRHLVSTPTARSRSTRQPRAWSPTATATIATWRWHNRC